MNKRLLNFCAWTLAFSASALAQAPIAPIMNIPNVGEQITPLTVRGSRFTYLNPGLAAYPSHVVGQGVSAVTSPDKKTLAVMTSGDYGIYTSTGSQDTAHSTEWIFIYNITGAVPVQTQVLQVTNTYNGIVFDPSSTSFYVAGGRNDSVHVYNVTGGVWAEAAGSPIALGHTSQAGGTSPEAAGIDINSDGTKLIVTNYENDSITLLSKSGSTWSKTMDLDLRPGIINPALSGTPGGAYPFWVTISGTTAYVSCMRDREIDVVNFAGGALSLVTRIKLAGQPLKSTLSGTTLYVAEDQADAVAAINTSSNTLMAEQYVGGPAGILPAAVTSNKLSGNNTNSVAVSPDGATLYVTNGNTNNIAVVSVSALLANTNPVLGLIPSAMYPNQVAVSGNGQYLYVVNGKSPAGPNAGHCKGGTAALPNLITGNCNASNSYTLQATKAGLQFIPVPNASQLPALTAQVAINNNYAATESASTAATMDFLATNIKHVIYIIKENRTFDQILGDLTNGANADPALAEFPAAVTPNLHRLATNFVTLDNFYDTSEVSYDGWAWSTGALAPDIVIRQTPVNYSFRAGLAYESEGDNRGINLVARTGTNAGNADVLPGLTDTDAPDGPGNAINKGYLWSAALAAGKTVRNYGFFDDNIGSAVAYPGNTATVQVHPANADLAPLTDLFYRGYDLNNADTYLFQEWQRDVDANGLANLSLIRMPHNHTGNFTTALAKVNTPELEVADNDYGVGLVIDKIANNPTYANNTLIFVIEDDAQNGGDHVDAHRSTAFIVGPYVKQGGVVVSTQYNTINFVRTMERILGAAPLHLTDAVAQPMADVFNIAQASTWTFNATPSSFLYNTTLPLPTPMAGLVIPKPTHDARYWAKVTRGLDFSKEDRVDPVAYNRIIWKGLKGDQLYPGDASLAETRKRYKEALKKRGVSVDADGDSE
jgi:DNA-binding beta-propeller fold protein YncE